MCVCVRERERRARDRGRERERERKRRSGGKRNCWSSRRLCFLPSFLPSLFPPPSPRRPHLRSRSLPTSHTLTTQPTTATAELVRTPIRRVRRPSVRHANIILRPPSPPPPPPYQTLRSCLAERRRGLVARLSLALSFCCCFEALLKGEPSPRGPGLG